MNILDRLKKIIAQATPGPWAVNQDGAEEWWYSDTILGEGGAGGALASCTEGNAELIVTAINALPALLEVAEAAKASRDWINAGKMTKCYMGDKSIDAYELIVIEKRLDAALAKLTEAEA